MNDDASAQDDAPEQDQAADQAAEQVGSLADEAARFAGAFASWALQHGNDLSGQAADAAAHVRESVSEHVHDMGEHVATGSAECSVCPVCRTIAAVRDVSPEVKTHLATAATSVVAAASALLGTLLDTAARPGSTEG